MEVRESQAAEEVEAGMEVEGGAEDGAGVESQRPRLPAKVREPSKEEREEHEASGCAVYRSWCPYCVQGRGQSNPHLPRQGASEIPEICLDYAYEGRDGEEPITLLCARCPELDHYACTQVASKGANRYSTAFLVAWIKSLGYKRIVVRSDNEAALLKLIDVTSQNLPEVEMVGKQSPEHDHQANGAAEAAVRECKGMIRSLRALVEDKYQKRFARGEPILSWIARHAANCRNRYRLGSDGRSAERRRTGRQWRKPTILFGEATYFRRAGLRAGARKDSGNERMQKGIYVGHHERTGSSLYLTPQGVVRGVGMHRLPEADRWDAGFLATCVGTPWEVTLGKPVGVAEEEQVQPPPMVIVRAEPRAEETSRRKFYITRADIVKYGATDNCKGCEDVIFGPQGGRNQRGHSEACRQRIMDALMAERERDAAIDQRMVRFEARTEGGKRKVPRPERQEAQQGEAGAPSTSGIPERGSEPIQ